MNAKIFASVLASIASLFAPAAHAIPFLISPLSFDFGDVATGDVSQAQTVTITNVTSSTQTINIAGGAAGVFGGATNCANAILAPGASCTVQYAFAPTDLGSASGSASLSVNGQLATFSFQGNAIDPFLVTPTGLDFGSVESGSTSDSQNVTITNVSSSSQTVNIAGGAAGVFGGATNCANATLAPGASCTISYAFTPTATGDVTGSANLSLNGQTYTFSFSGTGGTENASPFLVSPREFDFGNVPLEQQSAPQTVTITNVSSTPQTVNIAGGAAGLFGGATNCANAVLAPGASCTVSYAFTPTALGGATGSASLSLNGELIEFSFKGTGIDPFLISPLSFDFGEIVLGETSPFQSVDIFNVSDITRIVQLAGGAAGLFGGATNCANAILLPDESCRIDYAFTPTDLGLVTGSASILVNGMARTFSFMGIGIDPNTAPVPLPSTLLLLAGPLFWLHRRHTGRS